MCGIAGIIDSNIKEKEVVIGNMVKAITHRGPDDDGFFVDENVGLGMRRLSIIDLSTGRQPVTSNDGNSLIFFNGEIYNYLELKEGLKEKGHEFNTSSDTEVILHMYQEYGEKMLPRLRGMFAFCIYDIKKSHLFVARDFFGIKPVYYLVQGEQSDNSEPKVVAFSSEIKSFLSFPGFVPKVNDAAVVNYLSFQYNPLSETFFKGVYKLPPSHYLSVELSTGKAEIHRYWSFEFDQDDKIDEKKTEEKIFETMRDSVSHHMIADVPVGAFLSGGIDSSIIASLMQEIRGEKKIKTFTVGFDGVSEEKEARETSDNLGTDHKEITVGPKEYFEALPKAVYHFDEPVADPSAIGLYFLAKEARKSVKVVLSGEGSDELFGGYNIYLAPFARQKMSWMPSFIISALIGLPFNYFGKNYLKRVAQRLEDWYIGNASIFKKDEVAKLWKGKEEKSVSLKQLFKQVEGLSDSTKMQFIDIHTWLVGDILAKADKMTMANSLELRVPFLDTHVSRLARIMPDRFKWRRGVTKYLLREAFREKIPETTRNRKKLGFPTPVRNWFRSEDYSIKTKSGDKKIFDLILENSYIRQNMDTDYIRTLLKDHKEKKADNSRKIYTLLMLALWYDEFIKS